MRALLVIACAILAACGVNAQDRAVETVEDMTVRFDIEDTDGNLQREFRAGEKVVFVFELTNASTRSRGFSYTFPPHRIRVADVHGNTVWQAFEGRMFPQVMRDEALPPGGSKRFHVEWIIPATQPAGEYAVEPAFNAFVGEGRKPLQPSLPAVKLYVRK